MDDSNRPMNRQNDLLGVNKMGKNIKKSPIHQPNFTSASRQLAQPQVYNINKNDFRSIVQQLTGSPSQEPPHRPPQNQRKSLNNRLHRIRPPPLTPVNRPQIPAHPPAPVSELVPPRIMATGPYNNNFVRPPQHGQPQPSLMLPQTPNDVYANTAESPVSLYMRYLQNSFVDTGPGQPQRQLQGRSLPHPQLQSQSVRQGLYSDQAQPQPRVPPVPAVPSPRISGPPPLPSPRMHGPPPPLPSPRMHGPPPPLPSPRVHGPPPPLPSTRMNCPPPVLTSPTTQFVLPSPTGFLNMFSPQSPYPLLSPGFQNPPPLSPNLFFPPMAQSGVMGPGPQPPFSPGYGFPLSPSGFFPLSSPRWRDQ